MMLGSKGLLPSYYILKLQSLLHFLQICYKFINHACYYNKCNPESQHLSAFSHFFCFGWCYCSLAPFAKPSDEGFTATSWPLCLPATFFFSHIASTKNGTDRKACPIAHQFSCFLTLSNLSFPLKHLPSPFQSKQPSGLPILIHHRICNIRSMVCHTFQTRYQIGEDHACLRRTLSSGQTLDMLLLKLLLHIIHPVL